MSINNWRYLMSKSQSFTSLSAAMGYLKAQARAEANAAHAEDLKRAANLRRSASIARKAPGTGPRIAA
jgi:hypothetical protein